MSLYNLSQWELIRNLSHSECDKPESSKDKMYMKICLWNRRMFTRGNKSFVGNLEATKSSNYALNVTYLKLVSFVA